MCHEFVRDARFHQFLLQVDRDVAAATRRSCCVWCGSALHVADYLRKPRGVLGAEALGDEYATRLSFCCAREGCRARHTPPSLRFLGRRVYVAVMVVLVAAMLHGATPERAKRLQETIGVSRRTLERWRSWWQAAFVRSRTWRAVSGGFLPPVVSDRLPASLLERFSGGDEQRVVAVLRLLGPLTAGPGLARAS